MRQEYTQEELDNIKWKGININLKKDIHFKICDFGNACMHANHFTDDIQTREYRAPEVIIGHEYLPNTDVWSLACMVYELLTNSFLFKPKDKKGIGKDEDHLYMMIELLGPFPKAFALEGNHSKDYFNKKGTPWLI
jgi:serine/threonine protein kinase